LFVVTLDAIDAEMKESLMNDRRSGRPGSRRANTIDEPQTLNSSARETRREEAMPLRIEWCGNASRAGELAEFFARNVEASYISHSELQGPRALSPSEWRRNLPEILRDEIEPRLAAIEQRTPGPASRPILVAEDKETLVALSLVTFAGEGPAVPYCIVEDLVVDPSRRDQGIGKAALDWIAAEALARNINRLFLESGEGNHRAHHFFEREGFRVCSIVMMRTL
jgi:GNAT superfamily N-acetyltransferase